MVINRHRNKPIGPGGGTRRLHQFGWCLVITAAHGRPQGLIACSAAESWKGFAEHKPVWGRNRIDEGVKGALLPGMIPPLSGQTYSC